MTNLLKKILDLEKQFKDKSDKYFFELIKSDISILLDFTSTFIEYKFLLGLKRILIPANMVTENDLSPFNKWKLINYYKRHRILFKDNHKFLDSTPEEHLNEFKESFNSKKKEKYKFLEFTPEYHLYELRGYFNDTDNSIVESSLLAMKKYIESQKSDYPRFTAVFPDKKIQEIEKSILRYYLYKNNRLKLFNKESFFEDYFDKKNFTEPLEKIFSNFHKPTYNGNDLISIWFEYFVFTRMHITSNDYNTKNITGYRNDEKEIFKGKTEYNYFKLKEKIKRLDLELTKALSEIFSSDWLKSIILDLLCRNKEWEVDLSLELKKNLLKNNKKFEKKVT